MERICLNGTSLEVGRLSFGTGSLHHVSGRRSREALIMEAMSCGMSHFDTAPSYGNGYAECELGRILSSAKCKATVATKFGLYPAMRSGSSRTVLLGQKLIGRFFNGYQRPEHNWDVTIANDSLERSLRNLRRDCVDVLFLHEPTLKIGEADRLVAWLKEKRKQGKIRYWGIAGEANQVAPWARSSHEVAHLLQVRASAVDSDHLVSELNASPHALFGCLKAAIEPTECSIRARLSEISTSYPSATILVSTRNRARIPELAQAIV